MATATCNSNHFDLAQLHDGILSPARPCDSSTFPYPLRLPPSLHASDRHNYFLDDVTVSPMFLDSSETAGLQRQFDSPLNPSTFVANVGMTDRVKQSEGGPAGNVGRRRDSPPSSTRSRTQSTDTQTEQRQSESRSHSDTSQSTSQKSHSRTPPSSRKGQHRSESITTATATGSGSRSSSVARHRPSGRPRSKPGLFTAQQSHPERDLVAFHRESCRLFESFGQSDNVEGVRHLSSGTTFHDPTTRGPEITSNSASSQHQDPPPTTLASPNDRKPNDAPPDTLKPNSPTLHNAPSETTEPDPTPDRKPPVPPTVIDWTLPDTRKREYEKIDRSNRGIRGVWRRLAPRWCQGSEQRTPFFVEGKEHEGSVRRFRMDLPGDHSEDDDEDEDEDETKSTTAGANKRTDSKAGWDWIEAKVVRGRDRGGGGDGRRKSVLWSAARRRP